MAPRMGLFGSSGLIGLDIGTSSIKAVELNLSRKGAKLTGFAIESLPPGAIVNGEVADLNQVAEALKRALAKLGTKRKKIATGIWGGAVIVKKINLPRMDEKLVAEQIQWEAEQYIPFDKNEINLEFHILESSGGGGETMDVLLVAAKREIVMKLVESVLVAGLECEVVDVSGFALANSFLYNFGEAAKNEVSAIVSIGAGVTHFVIMQKGEVTLSRDIPAGGGTYTSEIQKQLNVSFQEAESLKISASTGQATANEVPGIISQVNDMIADEIKRTMDFAFATLGEITLQKFYLTGGGSLTSGLKAAVSKLVERPVEELNCFYKISIDEKRLPPGIASQAGPFAAVAIGLALRAPGDR